MSEVKRFRADHRHVVETEFDDAQFVSVSDYDAALARESALREELDKTRDDLIIFKSAVSALGEASKKLVFCARTSGGTAGPDQGLMDACAGVEGVITLGGISRAMNEFERLTAERDDLTARLEQARDRKNSIVDLQQRLTVSEQRLGEAYEWGYGDGQNAPNGYSDKEDRDKCIAELLKPAEKSEHICDGCGSNGWTGSCDKCIPY